MIPNSLKTRLTNDEPVYGMLTPVYDPAVVELTGFLGFDLYMLDCEHGAAGPMQAEHLVRACDICRAPALHRIRDLNHAPHVLLVPS